MLLHKPVTFKTYTSLSVSVSDFSITVSIDFLLLSESLSLQFFLGVLWCIICKGRENLMKFNASVMKSHKNTEYFLCIG